MVQRYEEPSGPMQGCFKYDKEKYVLFDDYVKLSEEYKETEKSYKQLVNGYESLENDYNVLRRDYEKLMEKIKAIWVEG